MWFPQNNPFPEGTIHLLCLSDEFPVWWTMSYEDTFIEGIYVHWTVCSKGAIGVKWETFLGIFTISECALSAWYLSRLKRDKERLNR